MSDAAVHRTLTTDLPPDELWREVLRLDWLGDDVRIDLRPGGTGELVDDEGARRHLVIDHLAGTELRFRWWTDRDGGTSDVVLAVHPEGEGAVLTVTETLVGAPVEVPAKGRRWECRLQALADRCASLLPV
jgi:hypothetical protein